MNPEQMMDAYVSGIRALVDPSSSITLLLGSILTAEIRLKPDNKELVCKEINRLIAMIEQAGIQIILAVLDDDNDRYVNLIGEGIEGNRIDTNEFPL